LMKPLQFSLFNILGAVLWVLGVGSLGFFLGEVLWIKEHIQLVVWALILIPSILAIASAFQRNHAQGSNQIQP